jgi:hypothetical protein
MTSLVLLLMLAQENPAGHRALTADEFQAAMDAGFLTTKAQVARVVERFYCDLANDVGACVDSARRRQDAEAATKAIVVPDGNFCWVALMSTVANVETLGALDRTISKAGSDEAKVAAVKQRGEWVETWPLADAETLGVCRGLNPLFANVPMTAAAPGARREAFIPTGPHIGNW